MFKYTANDNLEIHTQFTDLISATDSLSKLGFEKDEPQVEKAIEWLLARQ